MTCSVTYMLLKYIAEDKPDKLVLPAVAVYLVSLTPKVEMTAIRY